MLLSPLLPLLPPLQKPQRMLSPPPLLLLLPQMLLRMLPAAA
jgi:hypothetical protein